MQADERSRDRLAHVQDSGNGEFDYLSPHVTSHRLGSVASLVLRRFTLTYALLRSCKQLQRRGITCFGRS